MLCADLEGWRQLRGQGRLEKEGMYVDLELIPVVQQKLTQHCKAVILQFKNTLILKIKF